MMKTKSFGRFFGKAFVLLLVLQLLLTSAFAKEDTLSLYKNKESDNIPFAVADMYPGDYIKQDYCVRVSYNGTITVYFTADVRPGFEKLSEVLKCKVVMPDKKTLLYDGLMRDMPNLPCTLTGKNTTENLKYEIAVYLDTSVGNDYQNLRLVADFKWWAETSDDPDPPGGGGGGGGYEPDKPPVNPDDPDNPDIPPVDPDNPDAPDDPDKPPVTPDDPDAPPADPDGSEDVNKPTIPPDDPNSPSGSDDPDAPPTDPDSPATNPDGTPKGELIDPPYTGDYINPWLLIAIICISLLIIFLIIFIRKKNKKEPNKTARRLTISIAIIIILAIALCVTTFALVYSTVMVEDNIFETGIVKININDEKPIITDDEFLFEPGMTVRKEFFIKNESTDSVYYKIYMDNVHGKLADVLQVKLVDNQTGELIFSGTPKEFEKNATEPKELYLNEQRTFTVTFHYPEGSGNSTQKKSVTFDMCAVATQMRNNPDKKF